MRSLVFDTADKTNVQQLSTGFWNLNFNSIVPCTKVVISNIIVPRSFYNVYSGNNAIMIGSQLYNLTEGNYGITDLMSALQNLVSSIYPSFGFGITKNDLTGKLTFNSTSGLSLQFVTCYKLFGMNKNQLISLGNAGNSTPITSPYIYDLNSVPAVYLRCNAIHSNFIYNNSQTNILFRLPVNVPFGQLIVYQNSSSDFYFDVNNLTTLDFRLTDNYGTELNLNNVDWKIEMVLL